MREWDRSDPYTERAEYRTQSPYRGDYRGNGRDRRHDGGRGGQVAYSSGDHVYADALRFHQDGRAPKRPYRGRDRSEEQDWYAETTVVDVPYRGENDSSVNGQPMRLLLV